MSEGKEKKEKRNTKSEDFTERKKPKYDTLHVQIVEGKNFLPPNRDTADPMCTLNSSFNNQTFKTKVVKKSINPTFEDEHFQFYTSLTEGTLTIKVWNYEGFFAKNLLIGEVTLNVQTYMDGGFHIGWHPVNNFAEIKLAIHFTVDDKEKYPMPKGKKIKDMFEIGNVLGQGAFSKVYFAESKDKSDKNQYALKSINKLKLNSKEVEYVNREIDILKKLDHPHVIKLYHVYETHDRLFLLLEYAPGGELFEAIANRGQFLEWDAMVVVYQILKAVDYIHSKGVAHRDLKPENLLLANKDVNDFHIKLADFGLANTMVSDKLTTYCGTPEYAAPEIIKNQPYGLEVDVWSIGVITYVLLCGYAPFRAQNPGQLYRLIERGEYEFSGSEWASASEGAKDFIRKILIVDPYRRAPIDELLTHQFITGYTNGRKSKILNESFNPSKFREYREQYNRYRKK